jgi:hypothetical protein
MCHTNALVLTDESCDADRLTRLERKVPSGTMTQFLTVLRFDGVFVLDELLASKRMLALGEAIECFALHRATEPERVPQLAVPFAANRSALAEVSILGGSVLILEVLFDLAGGERFG